MTYPEFLMAFLILPICLMAAPVRKLLTPSYKKSLAIVLLVALIYTAPWDNYAAKHSFWTYAPAFVPSSHYIGYLPAEEYVFYILQGIFVCSVFLLITHKIALFKPGNNGSEKQA